VATLAEITGLSQSRFARAFRSAAVRLGVEGPNTEGTDSAGQAQRTDFLDSVTDLLATLQELEHISARVEFLDHSSR
jgi:hypothetical protein